MSLVRQLAKANAREAERRRVEEEQANRNISIEAIPNTVPAPDVNSDSFHNMTYTEICLGDIAFQHVQDSVAVVIPNKRGKYEKYTDKERYWKIWQRIWTNSSGKKVQKRLPLVKRKYSSFYEKEILRLVEIQQIGHYGKSNQKYTKR